MILQNIVKIMQDVIKSFNIILAYFYVWDRIMKLLFTCVTRTGWPNKEINEDSNLIMFWEIKHNYNKNSSKGPAFLWQEFTKNHSGHQNRLKIHVIGCKWVKCFYPYPIGHGNRDHATSSKRGRLERFTTNLSKPDLYRLLNKALQAPSFVGGCVIPITVPYWSHIQSFELNLCLSHKHWSLEYILRLFLL